MNFWDTKVKKQCSNWAETFRTAFYGLENLKKLIIKVFGRDTKPLLGILWLKKGSF